MKLKAILAVTAAITATAGLASDKSVTIASWGGSYQQEQRVA